MTSPAWSAEGNQIAANFGYSVATAGDVNGDGFSDVIVRAPAYDDGDEDEGEVFAYYGSAAGLSTSFAWRAQGNLAFAGLGSSVGTAGDVNGDGYADVIVGAHLYDNGQNNEGRAFVYLGSSVGLGASATWTAEIDQGAFGEAVASAGDVNGDGFSDVIVGAAGYDNAEADEGRTFVHYGNEGDGLDRIARQARTDESPLWPLGISDSESAFRLRAIARTPAGRGRARLQWKVKPAGVLFDGTGLVSGPPSNTGVPGSNGSAIALSQLVGGLTAETLYHWRLRIVTDSPYAPRSPWLWLPYNAATEADVRTKERTVSVAEGEVSSARNLRLGRSAPNPFASGTQFAYTLPEGGRHRLAVFDVQGRQVALLADRSQAAGQYTGRWDGRNARADALPSGVYFLRLEAGGQVEVQKVVIAR